MFNHVFGLIAAAIGSAQGGLVGYWLVSSYELSGATRMISFSVCIVVGVVVGFIEVGFLHGIIFRNKSDRNS